MVMEKRAEMVKLMITMVMMVMIVMMMVKDDGYQENGIARRAVAQMIHICHT